MKKLPEKSKLDEILRYDPETGNLFWKKRPDCLFANGDFHSQSGRANQWNAKYAGKEAFTATNAKGYKVGAVFGIGFLAHRVIWKMIHGRDPKRQIDHIDGNPANNRETNLREATPHQNACNRKVPIQSKFGHRGVKKENNGWRAAIKSKGVLFDLGKFDTLKEAVSVYQDASKIHHGDFAFEREE